MTDFNLGMDKLRLKPYERREIWMRENDLYEGGLYVGPLFSKRVEEIMRMSRLWDHVKALKFRGVGRGVKGSHLLLLEPYEFNIAKMRAMVALHELGFTVGVRDGSTWYPGHTVMALVARTDVLERAGRGLPGGFFYGRD